MSVHERRAAKVAALVASGAVIGAGIGLLFAPKSGAETRRDVGRYAKRAQLRASRWSRTVRSGVKDAINRDESLIPKEKERPQVEAV